ncbi:hypothetical protein KVV02_008535 [Mortierella alpina]|uniref:Cohesin loading factor n=1 Tax=Mortierella alpina TaxID=64518 RepID=A0A9P8A578_MORAP|nr:hypothetical protein KVV02_008535 [Mortierella alpina]
MDQTSFSQATAFVPEPSIISQGKTHLILWAMAEELVEQARSLCFIATTQPNSQPGWRKRHQDLVFSAIKCLVASVSVESPSMTQLDKAKARLRLAQILFEETESVERCADEINRAITIVDGIQGSLALDILLRLYDLQIQLFTESKQFRLAKNTLKIALAEAAKHDLHPWTYQLCLLKARVYFLTDDIAGSLATLNQGATLAEQKGEFDLKMAFWIVAGQYSLMLYDWDQAAFYLARLTPHFGLDELPDSASPVSTQSSTAAPQTRPSQPQQQMCQSNQLRVFFLILYICCMLRSGRVAMALSALAELHKALDETRPKDSEELQGIFKIRLMDPSGPNGTAQYPYPHPHCAQPSFISIKWMSFSQVYCLTYLLSGICSKADMTQPMKSQLFLVEGIKVVDREFSVNDHASATINVRRNQRWFSLLMMSMLLHLADVFLLKLELISVEETLLKATYWSKVCGMWDVFKWRISLSIGMTMHLAGRLEEALDWYGLCLNHSERAHQDQEGFDAKSLAIINTALIYCGERYHDLSKAKELQLEARARHASAPSTNILCALHILDSWTKEGLIPARQHLQEALKLSGTLLNTQLRSLTLLLLGNVYLQTHDEKAEKMLLTGFTHACKTSNHVVAIAAGSCLKGK